MLIRGTSIGTEFSQSSASGGHPVDAKLPHTHITKRLARIRRQFEDPPSNRLGTIRKVENIQGEVGVRT